MTIDSLILSTVNEILVGYVRVANIYGNVYSLLMFTHLKLRYDQFSYAIDIKANVFICTLVQHSRHHNIGKWKLARTVSG